MLGRVSVAVCVLVCANAFARSTPDFAGYVDVAPDRKLYSRIWYGADREQPPILLLNGLTQDTDHWKRMVPDLVQSGHTVIAFDFFHQGRTLDAYVRDNLLSFQIMVRPVLPPLMGERYFWEGREPSLPEISASEQARLIDQLLQKLGIKTAHVVGLSYGGGIALQFGADFPNRIASLSLLAPYVAPLATQDELIRLLMSQYMRMFPNQKINQDELYDYFLRVLVIYSYHLSEPTILKWGNWQPFAASELIRGVRKIDADALAKKLPKGSLNLVVAGKDAYIPEKTLRDFWGKVPKAIKGSLLKVEDVEHKVNESVGPFIGAWIDKIAGKDSRIRKGEEFSGHPLDGSVRSIDGRVNIEMPRTQVCETLLRPTDPDAPNLPVDRIMRYPGEDFLDRFMPQEWKDLFRKVAKYFWGL